MKLRSLLLLVFTSLVCATLAESISRLALGFGHGSSPEFFLQPGKIEGLVLGKPSTVYRQRYNRGDFDVEVKFNKNGLRDTRDVSKSAPNSIIVLGDSFAFGHGVSEDKRFSSILRDKYNLPVYNVAIPTGLDGYIALKAYASKLGSKSSNLILVLCMENDLVRKNQGFSIKSGLGSSEDSKSGVLIDMPSFAHVKSWLVDNSAFYYLLTSAIHNSPHLSSFFSGIGLIDSYMADSLGKNFEVDMGKTVEKIERILQGRNSMVFIVPNRYLWSEPGSSVSTELRQRHYKLMKLLRVKGVFVVDPLQAFERKGEPLSKYHFPNDGHWNPIGHQLVAQIIYSNLPESPLNKGLQ